MITQAQGSMGHLASEDAAMIYMTLFTQSYAQMELALATGEKEFVLAWEIVSKIRKSCRTVVSNRFLLIMPKGKEVRNSQCTF